MLLHRLYLIVSLFFFFSFNISSAALAQTEGVNKLGCIVMFKKDIRKEMKKNKKFRVESFKKKNRKGKKRLTSKRRSKKLMKFTNDMLDAGASEVKSIAKGITLVKGLECRDISKNPMVASSEINKPITINRVPNDQRYNQNYNARYAHQAINSEQAWALKTDSSNEVVIAVLDDSFDYNHPDLRDNFLKNTREIRNNGIDDDGNGYVDDYDGFSAVEGEEVLTNNGVHGTHVSGIVAAKGGNSIGVTGVSWKANILPIKVLSDRNGGGSSETIVSGLQYLIDFSETTNKRIIANMSLGYESSASLANTDAMRTLMQEASDILFVVAAGNSSNNNDSESNSTYPASWNLSNIISIAATGIHEQADRRGNIDATKLAEYSSYGIHSVDLAAPGTSIFSTFPSIEVYGGLEYINSSGTSMAAPLVAGGAALALSNRTDITPAALKLLLNASVTKLNDLEGRVLTGGMLDLGKLLSNDIPTSALIDVISRYNSNDLPAGFSPDSITKLANGNYQIIIEESQGRKMTYEYNSNGNFISRENNNQNSNSNSQSNNNNQEQSDNLITSNDIFNPNGSLKGRFITRLRTNGNISSTTHSTFFANTRTPQYSLTTNYNDLGQYTYTEQVTYNSNARKLYQISRVFDWINGAAVNVRELIESYRIHNNNSLKRYERLTLKSFKGIIREQQVTHFTSSGARATRTFQNKDVFFLNTQNKSEQFITSFHTNDSERFERHDIFFTPTQSGQGANVVQTRNDINTSFNGNVSSDCTSTYNLRGQRINATCR